MKRGLLIIMLCLALGLNLGILLMQLSERFGGDGNSATRHYDDTETMDLSSHRGPWERRGRRFRDEGERGRRLGERLRSRLADSLELAGEEREHFLDLQEELMRSSLEERIRRRTLEQQVRQELIAEVPDEARIDQLISEIASSFVAAERNTAKMILESRRLLDEKQQRRYLNFLGELRSRRGVARMAGERERRP